MKLRETEERRVGFVGGDGGYGGVPYGRGDRQDVRAGGWEDAEMCCLLGMT